MSEGKHPWEKHEPSEEPLTWEKKLVEWEKKFETWANKVEQAADKMEERMSNTDSPPPPGPDAPPSDPGAASQGPEWTTGGRTAYARPPRPPRPPKPPFDATAFFGRAKNLLLAFLVLYGLLNCFYTVGPDEVGLVLRLGAYQAPPRQPGFHFKLPFGVDTIYKPRVKHTFKEEFGFRTLEAGQRTIFQEGDFSHESLHVTADLDIADVQWSLHYRIVDPFLHEFHTRNVTETVRYASEVAMREVVGDHSFDETVVKSRDEIENEARIATNKMLKEWQTGVYITNLKLRHAKPPKPVEKAFNEVNEARQEMVRHINEGQAEYNKEVPAAQGKAQAMIQQAEGYRQERINLAYGESGRFLKLLKEYQANKQVTRRRLHLETLQDILPRTKKKLFVSGKDGNLLKWLNLRRDAGSGGVGP